MAWVGLLAVAIASAFFGPLRLAVWSAVAVLAVLSLVDYFLTPDPERLEVDRRVPSRAGLDEDFERVLRVGTASTNAAGLRLEIHEEFPDSFEVRARTLAGEQHRAVPAEIRMGDPSGGPDRIRLAASGAVEARRTYRGHRRGLHELGSVRLLLRGPLGLVDRVSRLEGRQGIRIVPALAGLRRTLKLAASERWKDLGVHNLRRRGGATEFESLRDHVHGDDVRIVDWKAFARRGKPIVREYQEERGQELILLLDCGRRMAATTARGSLRGWTKLDHALDAGLQLAAIALQRGDRVGALAFDDKVRAWVPPRRGSRQVSRLFESLFDIEPRETAFDLARALREVAIRHRRRATIAVLSDVADPLSIEHQSRALSHGSRNHSILLAALDDPSLRQAAEGLPGEEGSEHPSAVRAAAMHLAGERRASLRRLAAPGVRVIDTLPAEAAGPLLAAWLEARRRF